MEKVIAAAKAGDYRGFPQGEFDDAKEVPPMREIFSHNHMGHSSWSKDGWSEPNVLGCKPGLRSGMKHLAEHGKIPKKRSCSGVSSCLHKAAATEKMWPESHLFFPLHRNVRDVVVAKLLNLDIFDDVGRHYPGTQHLLVIS